MTIYSAVVSLHMIGNVTLPWGNGAYLCMYTSENFNFLELTNRQSHIFFHSLFYFMLRVEFMVSRL